METANLQQQPQAYVPVYAQPDKLQDIKLESARAISNAGKVYIYGNTLYQNEVNEGIHIVDISNPAAPRKLAFLKVPFSTEVAVRGNYLYTNNFEDLVTFDLTQPAGPQLVSRIADVFGATNQEYPPFFNVFFQCPDPSKGVVVDWELKTNIAADCRR